MEENNNVLQAYTPGSDIAAAFQPSQINWGRTGNDIVIGYNTINSAEALSTFDILVGDIEIPLLVDPFPRTWQDKFILGDSTQPYYANGNPLLLGLNDLAVIIDFDPLNDTIQLNGKASDYQSFDFFLGTVIWRPQEIAPGIALPDIVAIVAPTLGLDLNANYFKYTDDTSVAPFISEGKQIGTPGFELSNAITTDEDGNVYVAGGTSGELGGPNQGNRDVWFAKYDEQGNEIWKKQFGTTDFDFPFGIDVDGEGNVYLAGSTQGELTTPLASEISDAWLAKFDQNGDPVWQRQFDNQPYNLAHNAYAIDVTTAGNIRISGVSVETTPEGSDLPNTADAWVANYDTDGNQIWFQQLATPNDQVAFDESYAIALDEAGNAFAAGFTTGAIGDTPFGGLYDGWVAKVDPQGNKLWAKNIASLDYDWAWAVDTDQEGSVYVTGWTLGDVGGTNAGSFDAWLVKYDPDGNQEWIRQFGTSGDDEAFGLRVDDQGNVYVTGYTNGAFDGHTNQGEFDAWVTKFDPEGNQGWIQQFGTPGTEQAYDIAVQNDGVYVTGLTDGSFGSENQGSFDGWLVKLNAENGEIEDFTGTSNSSNAIPQPSGAEILALDLTSEPLNQDVISQEGESSGILSEEEAVAIIPLTEEELAQLELTIASLAEVLQVTPNTVTNSLEDLNLFPYENVGPALDTTFNRFHNGDRPGSYLFAAETESVGIRQNFPQFLEEGPAFIVGSEPRDELIRFNRFHNNDVQGTFLYATEAESESIRQNFPQFFEDGIAFYAYPGDANLGEDFYRLQNTQKPGIYIYVNEEEKDNILANFPQFTLEGVAFEAEVPVI